MADDNIPPDVRELIQHLRTSRAARPQQSASSSLEPDQLYASLASIWRDILDVPEVKADDNIFDLGGDSIHIVQIASRIRSIYGVEITFGEFFDAPTVRELGSLVRLLAEQPREE